mmetsp:Transcript_15226/g.44828  ORF Transcript_15226/g.44828 Transcript_15226/m.44828 type:complete len:151 (-) Transcript_15226:237-689(-)
MRMPDFEDQYAKNAQAYMLLASSLIVLIASAKACDDTNQCADEFGYAVAVSVVSVALTLFYLIGAFFVSSLCETVAPWLSAFLMVWWFPGAFVLTFNDPFRDTGNGYFGSWASLIFAIQWLQITGSPIRFGGSSDKADGDNITVPPQSTA